MAIDSMLDQIEKEQIIDIFGYTMHIRSQRSLMVQTEVGTLFFPQFKLIQSVWIKCFSSVENQMNVTSLNSIFYFFPATIHFHIQGGP